MWSLKLGLHLLSPRFLLGDILWFGLAHLVELRLYLVSLRLSGVGVLDGVLLCRLRNHKHASGGVHVEHEGRR
jgi:hypothetical protein